MKKYFKGLQPDPEDTRDYPVSAYLAWDLELAGLPRTYTVPNITPVRDQGRLGSCAAFASVVGLKEQQEFTERLSHKVKTSVKLSPLFVYQLAKLTDGLAGEGTYLRSVLKVMAETGVCLEQCLPYRPRIGLTPCSDWKEQAEISKIKTYAKVDPFLDEIKQAIYQYGGMVMGVYTTYQWSRVNSTGVITFKGKQSRKGGHAIYACGWDDDKKLMKFKNSWGPGWGEKGFGYLTYEYLISEYLSGWTAVDI